MPFPLRHLLLLCAGLGAASLIRAGQPPPVRAQTRGIAPERAPHGMVASASAHASRAGVEILRRGGNAVDAAVAVGLALAVTYPSAGNLGGGGFMLIRMADGRSTVIDFREVAPARARRDMYLDAQGNVIPEASTVGYRAAGVPGTVAGLALALEKHGSMEWRRLVEPARRLAERGFPAGETLARELRSSRLERFPESRRVFLRDGRPHETGDTFRQPDLARTLRRLQEKGPREFYGGDTARLIARDMEANGGLISLEDLRSYRPVERRPLRGTYRGHEILTMPPPSSGGIALLEMLNILEPLDIRAMGHSSSRKYHVMIEAMRWAFADRAEFPGDPDFVRVPVAGLVSKRYGTELLKTIDLTRATPSDRVRHGQPPAYESPQTTHYSVVDRMGNAVSTTYTLNGAYGSGVTVRGAGFLLNNEMDDFTAKPGTPNLFGLVQGEANRIEPRKRPLSSMTPTILLKNGKLHSVYGSPGGPTIINTVLQVTLNLIDHEMNLQQAVSQPRFHHQWLPDRIDYEPYGAAEDVLSALRDKGHRFADRPRYIGDVQAVMIEPETGTRLGTADPRSPDALAAGY
jgi:gamma-glutamyltranspeptidase / glutathione hydrolase